MKIKRISVIIYIDSTEIEGKKLLRFVMPVLKMLWCKDFYFKVILDYVSSPWVGLVACSQAKYTTLHINTHTYTHNTHLHILSERVSKRNKQNRTHKKETDQEIF